MAEQPTYKFLPEDKCLTEAEFFDYIDGKLNAADMYRFEKHILDCEMCSDALEGLEKVSDRKKVAGIIAEKIPSETKVIPLHPNRKYYALAAGIVLILCITFVARFSLNQDKSEGQLAVVSNADSISTLTLNEQASELSKKDSTGANEKQTDIAVNKTIPAPSGAGANGDYFKSAEKGNTEHTQAEVADEQKTEVVTMDDGADMDANDGLANIVDAKKPGEERSLSDKEVAKDRFGVSESKQSRSEAKKNKAADDNRGNAQPVAKSEDVSVVDQQPVPSVVSGNATSLSSSSPTTIVTNQTAKPDNFTWTAPSSGSTGGVVSVNDSTSYKVSITQKSDKELDLSYENGVKMLSAGQASVSVSMFDEVLKNPNHPHFQDAQWKKAEALIQLKRIDEAKKLLNEIIAKNGKYTEDAKAKLKTL
ncbi:hypothetical protein BH09BAC5_BH09BAC5_26300 [soil metagenome]